jgi:diguanylate cyclase (GGDEF)-like protein
LLGHVNLKTRLYSLCGVLLCPLILLAGILSNTAYNSIAFSQKEQDGVRYFGAIFPLILDVASDKRKANPSALDAASAHYDTDMKSWDSSTKFRVSISSNFSKLEKVKAGQQLIAAVGDGSNLILDPDLDSYYVMDIVTNKLPTLLTLSTEVDQVFSDIKGAGDTDAVQRLTMLVGQIRSVRAGLDVSMQAAIRNNASGNVSRTMLTSYSKLSDALNQQDRNLDAAIQDLIAGRYDPQSGAALRQNNAQIFAAMRPNYMGYLQTLESLLQDRINKDAGSLLLSLLVTLAAAAAALSLAVLVAKRMTNSVDAIRARIQRLQEGDFTSPIPLQDQKDELGDIARALTQFRAHSEEKARLMEQLDEQRISAAKKLQTLAYIDDLTGLSNRKLLNATFEKHAASMQGTTQSALIFFDLDGFKEVNDILNHTAGDLVLQEVARRLQNYVKGDEIAARLGGDEFAIFLPNAGEREEVLEYCNRILRSLAEPYRVHDTLQFLSGSAGIALLPLSSAHDGIEIVRRADVAMYRAKTLGKNQTIVFDPTFDSEVLKRREIENELRAALKKEEVALYFQPQFDVASGKVVSLEGLARWSHARLGDIPPSTFIPIAERGGLINELGRQVMLQAVKAAKRWPDLRISINISVAQLRHHQFMNDVMVMVAELGGDVSRIELEITESVLMEENPVLESRLAALRDFGFILALDDFGTGFASLGYLSRFHFDRLKIDRSFVSGAQASDRGAALLQSITNLGLSLGMDVCAEGVETYEGVKSAATAGCTLIQGFYFSPAVDSAAVDEMVSAQQNKADMNDYNRLKLELAQLEVQRSAVG